MLWAGIMFIWELVGVDLEKAKEAGGTVGVILTAIKSPQAVPWALFILVAYFMFKLSIEWHQCNASRRRMRVARIDYVSAWIVAVTAYFLYLGQALSRVQFADILQGDPVKLAFFGFVLSSALTLIGCWLVRWYLFRKLPSFWIIFVITFLLMGLAIESQSGVLDIYHQGLGLVHLIPSLIGAAVGAVLVVSVQRPWRLQRSEPDVGEVDNPREGADRVF
jgi:hypothetical protein